MTHVVRTLLEKKWNVENGMSVSGFQAQTHCPSAYFSPEIIKYNLGTL